MKTFALALLSATVIASALSAFLILIAPMLSKRYSSTIRKAALTARAL